MLSSAIDYYGGKVLLELIKLCTLILWCTFSGTDTRPTKAMLHTRQWGDSCFVEQTHFIVRAKAFAPG